MSVVANVAINVDSRGAVGQLKAVQQGAVATDKAFDKLNATTAAAEGKFKVAANGVKYFTDATGRARAENGRFLSSSERAAAGLQAQGRAAQQASGQMSGLISGLGKLAAAYLGLRTAQQAFQASIQVVESERRVAALAKVFGETAQAQEAAARAAQKFGLSQTEANESFAQIYARLRPIGVSLAEIETAFNGFNTAAKLSRTSTQQASGAWLQLSQALGSGVLRGEELNSVFEQTPAVVQAIAKEMGAPIGQIRQLAQDGKITSDIVIRALKRIEIEGAGQLAEAMTGPAQQVKNLQNEFEKLQIAATKDLIPSMIGVVKELRGVLESLGPVLRSLGGIAAQTLGTIADLINAATKPKEFAAATAIRGGRLPMAGLGGISGAEELFKGSSGAGGIGLTGLKKESEQLAKLRKQPVTEVLLELMKNRLARMETPTVTPTPTLPSGPGVEAALDPKAAAKAAKAAEKAAKLAQKLAEDSAQYQIQIDDQIFKNQVELDKMRYDLQRQLQEKQLSNFVNKFTGAAKEQAGIIQSMVMGSASFDAQIKDIENKIKEAQQRLQSGTRMNQVQSTTVGGGGGFSTSQLNTATQAASKFTGVANMCSESVKAFYGSLGITLPGVTAWADTVRKAGTVMTDFNKIKPGDILATGRPGDTPHVGVYTGGQNVFHQSKSRGLKAGNYPDLNSFKGGYFVRPNAAMGGVAGGVPGQNVDQIKAEIQGLIQQLALLKSQSKSLKAEDLAAGILASTSAFREQTAQLGMQTEAFTLRNRLQMEGVKPELIEGELKLLEVRQQLNDRLKPFNELLASGTMTQEQYAEATNGIKTAAEAAAIAIQTYTAATVAASSPIQQFIASAKTQLNDLESVAVRVSQGIGDAVGSSLTKGVQGLIEGTTTAQQVFADFLKSVGDILMQEGAKMIATYTAIAIAKSLAGLFGGGGGGSIGGGDAFGAAASSSTFNPGTSTAFGGMSIPGFAAGGTPPVGRPSLVGEQGPELFVPRTAGTIVPAGPTAGIREAMANGNGQSNASPVLNMSFETSTINGVEYVSRDQLETAMMETRRQASRDGAKRGMTMTLDRLQQSPSTRSRVGLG